jgi:hypothetical protein
MDDKTLAYIRERVAVEAHLPTGWDGRLQGTTLSELRDDAARLAKVLGAETEPDRDEHRRYVGNDMNAHIRSARGTTIPAAPAEREPEPGRLGAGHGGANTPQPPNMSDLIREASGG